MPDNGFAHGRFRGRTRGSAEHAWPTQRRSVHDEVERSPDDAPVDDALVDDALVDDALVDDDWDEDYEVDPNDPGWTFHEATRDGDFEGWLYHYADGTMASEDGTVYELTVAGTLTTGDEEEPDEAPEGDADPAPDQEPAVDDDKGNDVEDEPADDAPRDDGTDEEPPDVAPDMTPGMTSDMTSDALPHDGTDEEGPVDEAPGEEDVATAAAGGGEYRAPARPSSPVAPITRPRALRPVRTHPDPAGTTGAAGTTEDAGTTGDGGTAVPAASQAPTASQAPAATVGDADEPAFPAYVEYATSEMRDYVVGAVLAAASIAAILTLFLAVRSPGVGGLLAVTLLVAVAAGAWWGLSVWDPAVVSVRDGVLTVATEEREDEFDLRDPRTTVDLAANPRSPAWKATVSGPDGKPTVIRAPQVKVRHFVALVEHHRAHLREPELEH